MVLFLHAVFVLLPAVRQRLRVCDVSRCQCDVFQEEGEINQFQFEDGALKHRLIFHQYTYENINSLCKRNNVIIYKNE